jgi:hypothetical protein
MAKLRVLKEYLMIMRRFIPRASQGLSSAFCAIDTSSRDGPHLPVCQRRLLVA